MTHQLYRLPASVLFTGGVLAPGWKVYFYLTGTTTPTPVYTTSALSVAHTQPVVADSAGVMRLIYLDPSITYKSVVYDEDDVLQSDFGADPVNDSVLSQSVIGSLLYPRTAAEIAAGVTPTNYAYPELNLRRYGGAPGSGDNTSAMDQAEAVVAALGGGEIILDTPGVWKMNWVCTTPACVVRGVGGRSEYDIYCIRPYSLTSAPVTFGDGATTMFYCGLINIHVSGTDGSTGADRQSAKSAPHCLRLRGGVVQFTSFLSHYYNGIKTISMEPSATLPVTGVRFISGSARNDLFDSTSARTIYATRLADPGYYTDNIFVDFKLNGPGDPTSNPTRGYLAEFDGTGGPGMLAEFANCYADLKADFTSKGTVCHGVLLKNAYIKAHGLTLDPGTTGACIIETTDALSDIGRYIVGEMRHGGQKMLFSGATAIDIPAEADSFTYKHRLHTPFTVGTRYLGVAGDSTAYPTSIYWELQSTSGPDGLFGCDLAIKTAGKGLQVKEGSNAKQGVSTLSGGSVVVANTSITANSRIMVSRQNVSGTPGHLSVSRSTGVSFTITSTSGTDASDVAWQIFEPA